MTPLVNRQWRLKQRPTGNPSVENFEFSQVSVPELQINEILVKTIFLSVDPYMRGRMRNVRSYVKPLEINEVLEGGVVGQVVHSRHLKFKEGDIVSGRLGWQDYAISNGEGLRKLSYPKNQLSMALGVLGMTGLTAYFALKKIGQPKKGETILISGAAGAVGSVVGQLAKLVGCQVVGIAGSDIKIKFLKEECGFDAAFNYKTADNIRKSIKDHCPQGVDIYFDNVGGEISDAVITQINLKARIIICGQISIANREKTEFGPRNLLYLLVKRARMEGFLVHDYQDEYEQALNELEDLVMSGKIKSKESMIQGLENAPKAFIGLFSGDNIGKQLVQVSSI
ncbi:MAG: NADP-dependent oxidoreductase [Elusimicrobiota bacterium]